jgi:hypothetical protein
MLDFGKLTMRHVDLTMIDASQDPWFDLDLVNYQAQLVNGYTRPYRDSEGSFLCAARNSI